MRFLSPLPTLLGVFFCGFALGGSASAQSFEYDIKNYNKLSDFIDKNQVGEGQDFFLELKNAFDDWEKVILIFGYWDDWEVCAELAGILSARYPLRTYRCIPAN
jgi:hypothetical protein